MADQELWQVEPKAFIEVLKVLDLVPLTKGLPASSYIRIRSKADTLQFDLSSIMSGSVSMKGSGAIELDTPIFVDRTTFIPFIMTAENYKSKKPFEFTLKKNRLIVEQGSRKAVFETASKGSGYADVNAKTAKPFTTNEDLLELLGLAAAYGMPEEQTPELSCVYVAKNSHMLNIYSMNRHLSFKSACKVKDAPEKLALPLALVGLLKAQSMASVLVNPTEVILKFPFGCLWQSLSRKASESFPRTGLDNLVATSDKWPLQFQLDAHRLQKVTDRFALYLASVNKENWALIVSANAGDKQARLQAKIAHGTFDERVPFVAPIKKAIKLEWPLDLLLPALAYLGKGNTLVDVKFSEKTTDCLLSCGDTRIFVTYKREEAPKEKK